MRRRLRRHEVPVKATTVTTIDAWSFNLARRMPLIGQTVIPNPPDWTAKAAYCAAATRVIGSRHIRRVVQLSYDLAIVDEYQDCSLDQHHIVDALTAAVPVVVFGRLVRHITAGGLAVHPARSATLPQTDPLQPTTQHLTHPQPLTSLNPTADLHVDDQDEGSQRPDRESPDAARRMVP